MCKRDRWGERINVGRKEEQKIFHCLGKIKILNDENGGVRRNVITILYIIHLENKKKKSKFRKKLICDRQNRSYVKQSLRKTRQTKNGESKHEIKEKRSTA